MSTSPGAPAGVKPMSEALERNIAEAERFLARFARTTLGHHIGGAEQAGRSGETFANAVRSWS